MLEKVLCPRCVFEFEIESEEDRFKSLAARWWNGGLSASEIDYLMMKMRQLLMSDLENGTDSARSILGDDRLANRITDATISYFYGSDASIPYRL